MGLDRVLPAAAGELSEAGVDVLIDPSGVELLDVIGCVVKSPGVPREAPVIAAALERGIVVMGELELGWRMLPNRMVAVTGTNGKTTTVELIGEIYRAAGLPVVVAGNVGRALSSFAAPPAGPLTADTTIVCEVSSFQLEDTLEFAPDAAVLLNLEPDHLNRHHTFERYRDAKLRIFEHQTSDQIAVLPASLAQLEIPGHATRIPYDEHAQLAKGELRMRGAHNLANAMAARAVTVALGVSGDAVRAAMKSFPGVVHRIEEIATQDGVLYVNDSKATNIASTLVALASFAPGSVHLILGGQGKGQDFSLLREAVAGQANHVYLIGEDAAQIAAGLTGLPYTLCETLDRAVQAARTNASPGDVILLSPACASFDQFADFEDRGNVFRKLVSGEA
jgi:UDP-N-acetylmuramoylalanine--D-glutamate ligase